jgi:hypothetical protein
MPETSEYVAILRCQTWNVWPEKTAIEHRPFQIAYEDQPPVPARLAILSYLNRTKPESYQQEPTTLGPLVWDGAVPGFHLVRDTILKAPEDVVEVACKHRNSQRGEIDICINFKFPGEVPPPLLEAVRATASAIMSLINLRLKDYLTPSVPFQLRKLVTGGESIESAVLLAVRSRSVLSKESLDHTLSEIANALVTPQNGEKLRVALELYAAHFTERQVRVRFLLLVMAMETLAQATSKHPVAISLLERWHQELKAEMANHIPPSEEFKSLEALSRELSFRAEDSIRSQVRKLFRGLNDTHTPESDALERRALHVYDKRSTLVHDGYLPTDELSTLEREARELLEMLFLSVTAQHGSGILASHDPSGV